MKNNIDSVLIETEKQYKAAIALRDKNKLHESERLFQKIQKVFKKYNCFHKYCECLNNLSIVYINLGKFKEADYYLRTGLKISQKYNQLKNTANILGNIGLIKYYRGFYKEAMEIFKEELKINKKLKNKFGEQIATGKIANVYFDTTEYAKAIQCFKIQEKLCSNLKNKQSLSYAYGGLAQCYLLMYDFENTFYYLNKQISLCEEIDERRGLSIALCNTGYAYFKKQDYDLSISYFFRALDNDKKLKNIRGLIYIYSSLGNVYKSKKDYTNSLKYFKKELYLSIKLKMHRQEASSLGDIGIIYKVKKQYNSALKVIRKQTNICRKYNLSLPLFFALDNLGEIYRQTNNNKLSLKYFNEQLTLSKKVFGIKHPNTSAAYRNLGNAYFKKNNFKESLSCYQKSLISNSKIFNSHSCKNNPVAGETYSEQELFETLIAKAVVLRKLYGSEENSLFDLELSLAAYELALDVVDKIRTGFREENSKYFMIENLLPVYEEAIDTAVELFNITIDEKYLEKAFYFAEKNKAVTLLENIKESEAKIVSDLPKEILEKENSLKLKISYNESEKHKELQKGKKSDKKIINKFDEIIFDLKREYNTLIEKLEKNYPEYYSLKNRITEVSLNDIKRKLVDEKSIFIEYFTGEKNIYIFKITKDKISAEKISRTGNFDKSVNALRDSLITNSLVNFSANFKKFSINAYKLYLTLLRNVLNDTENKSNLIIIPDSIIGYIPFEALITEPPIEKAGYKNLSYLIKYFTVSYGFSSAYLLKNTGEQTKINQKKIIGFAPTFENKTANFKGSSKAEANFRSQLVPLSFNESELNEIGKFFPGDYFIKKNATKKTFLNSADKYSIIHLATHCLIDEKNPMFSKICFAQSQPNSQNSKDDDDYLHGYELYNLKLNSRLAVLSACHTGFGKLIKGEGILSIARGFAYSNCNSIVMSLWQVNDQSTSKIMAEFYKELFYGKKIDASLRLAKLSYMNNANEFNASPFFWAPFVLIGNSEPIKFFSTSAAD